MVEQEIRGRATYSPMNVSDEVADVILATGVGQVIAVPAGAEAAKITFSLPIWTIFSSASVAPAAPTAPSATEAAAPGNPVLVSPGEIYMMNGIKFLGFVVDPSFTGGSIGSVSFYMGANGKVTVV